MAECIGAGGIEVELEEGPREGTLRCPACGAILDENTLEELSE